MKKRSKNFNVKSSVSIQNLPKAKLLSEAQLVQVKGGIRAQIISIG